jgi:hypothetical protein
MSLVHRRKLWNSLGQSKNKELNQSSPATFQSFLNQLLDAIHLTAGFYNPNFCLS